MDNDDSPDPQPEFQLGAQGKATSLSMEGLQKQVRELHAKLDDHQKRTGLDQSSLWEEHLFSRKLLTGLLAALLLLNLGLLPFLTKQMRLARRQLPNQRVLSFNLRSYMAAHDPALREWAAQLQAFSLSHPDFLPVLTNYQRRLPDYFPAPAPNPPSPQGP